LIEATTEEAKASPDPPSSPSTSKKRKRKGKRETDPKQSEVGPTHAIEYDETLLAVVGILDEVKFQSNVASWVRENGLRGPHPTRNLVGFDAFPQEIVSTTSDGGSVDSGRIGEGKKRRVDAAVVETPAMDDESEDRGSLRPPTNVKQNQENVSETPLWFDNPPTMQHWVDRGRKALAILGIPIEHGLKQ
jgi:hypothetical protein